MTDSDGDSTPNHLDLDSDNDGIFDLVETGGTDEDNDGMIDSFLDSDGDGRATPALNNASLPDADNNGIPDFIDADAEADTGVDAAAPVFTTGVGCSIVDGKPSLFDPLLALLAVASATMLRRRKPEIKHSK